MSRWRDRRLWAPLGILAVGAAGAALLLALRPDPPRQTPPEVAPLVRVVEAQPQAWRFSVRTHGTVEPRTESDLVPQVSGEVVWVSPDLVSGGFFDAGEPLLRIDRADYRVELESARATLARTESEFERASIELERQRKLRAQGVASQARIDDAENTYRVAEAELREARARVEQAERDLERTELRGPYEGRVRSEDVDVGQFVSRGDAVATLYAVDWAEVPLPVPDRELRYLDVPLGAMTRDSAGRRELPHQPEVRLHAEFAGRPSVWTGRIVRSEGEIDPRSRMITLVARVEDPYGLHAEQERPPLAVGQFVEAEILGRTVEDVYVLPREALRVGDPMDRDDPDRMHVVDAEGRLRLRPVELLRTEREHVVIASGLAPGDRVSISPLQAAVEGMRVRVVGDAADPAPDAAEGEAPDAPEEEAAAPPDAEPEPTEVAPDAAREPREGRS